MRRGKSLDAIAGDIERATADAVRRQRSFSRLAGVTRLEAEARGLGLTLTNRSAALLEEAGRDIKRAASVARRYADRWALKAGGIANRAKAASSIRSAALAANVATDGSLKRIGATESSEAFNTGRAKYIRIATTALLRVWDATNDRRTCPTCSSADGTIVGVREPFPTGEPGAVHPFCRCSWTLLTAAEADSETLITPAA